jgi:hypothetical protein
MVKSFELMDLVPHERQLIELIDQKANRFYLAPLDKGLSGARTLLVRWSMDGNLRSAQHVVKIGSARKIEREFQAVKGIRPLLPRLYAMRMLPAKVVQSEHRMLLQEYAGGDTSVPVSLRQWLGNFAPGVTPTQRPTIQSASRLIGRIFSNALKEVHFQAPSNYANRKLLYCEALDWWLNKGGDLRASSVYSDLVLLDSRFVARGLPSAGQIFEYVAALSKERDAFSYGYIHGDLHTQNVLVDSEQSVNLIDFAWAAKRWRAIDFIMMECSLKFVCAPFDADTNDLFELEGLIDKPVSERELESWSEATPFGREMVPAASAVIACRRLALECGATSSLQQYRKGLVLMTSALATRPGLNRLFLLYSLAQQCRLCMEQ